MQVTPAQREQIKHSVVLVIPALLFGLLVSAQWQSQQERSELTVRYNAPLTEAANALQNEQNGLKVQIAELRARLDEIQANAATQSGSSKELQARIDDLKAQAGLTPVSGNGAIVVLDDAKATTSIVAKDVDKSICHATDLTDILNTAWRGGAQAVAINDERIVNTSSVYCVGSTIMVNGTLMSPPFHFTLIGPQDALLATFSDPAQLRDIKQRRDVYGLGFRVSRANNIFVPAFTGAIAVRYATVVATPTR